ncbi:Glucosyl-isoprenylphosphate transferase [Altererythrobacter epoxidivorans]|uniref:Glucosyl-isoprenylphosphate transferase n=1 Tax=Altererythrobacter epoxidivorans TaxID=361183 RepID=A0A0M3TAU4_9SPHN|nr:sugar transferase [Altererythrobacter epoxidivorans]ALE17662.1 Glucosyl-isoprenylphosphate transferase [Altererythrobacter epoxidivorans]
MNKPADELVKAIAAQDAASNAAPSLERRRLWLYASLLFGDAILFMLGFALGGLLYEGIWLEQRALMQAQLMLPLFYTIAFYNSTYCARALTDTRYALKRVAITLAISAALLNFIAFYLKTNAVFSRGSFTLGLMFTVALLAAFRIGIVKLVASVWNGQVRNFLVIDDAGPAFALEGSRRLSAAELGLDPESDDPHMLNRLGRILNFQDRVIVTCPPARREGWARRLKAAGVQGEVVSSGAFELGALGVVRYEDQSVATLIVSTGPLGIRARAAKRAFDLTVACTGIVVLFPLLVWAAIRIKLEDGGPIFFVQRRLGRGNRFFNMYKLRTMSVALEDQAGDRSTSRNDSRITRVGRTLRSTSIDELPQLLNVLRGEMSVVGPRPHALGSRANDKFFWDIDSRYWKRHSLKPGLTGLAQVRGQRGSTREEQDLVDRLQSDLEYIAGWSIARDVAIAWRTFRVLRHEQAY